jgi:Luciferase-like monooxygenase
MVTREAEDAGFDTVLTAAVNNNALATAQLMGTATQHIQVGTWVANSYLRLPYVCAQGAALTDPLLDAVCLLGPEARCSEQLAAFRAAGVDLAILPPPVGVEGARPVIQVFRRCASSGI